MSRSESGGNPTKVNAQGYAGEFQFGAPRLADLGVYQPGQGETDPKTGKWNGQMNGQFNIPQFPDVKTKADFLANQPANVPCSVSTLRTLIAQLRRRLGPRSMTSIVFALWLISVASQGCNAMLLQTGSTILQMPTAHA